MGILTAGPLSLFSKVNKAKEKDLEKDEGVVSSLDELSLDLDDAELVRLSKDWEKSYDNSETKKRIQEKGTKNLRYWMGKQFADSEYVNNKTPLSDNIIFEAVETMIPQATQQSPEPIVLTDNTPDMKKLGEKLKMVLEYLADTNNLKAQLKKGVRHWSLRFLGCWKIGYDAEENEIVVKTINPKDLILDPTAPIEEGEYKGGFLGERMTDLASNLVIRFPKYKEEIELMCEGKMGSIMGYIQWWTNDYIFYRMGNIILDKSRNPHWNYDKELESYDENGESITKVEAGKNHFNVPKMPYVFLTVFDLGDEPCDKTNLVEQGLITQDNINKRLKQIDKNIDNINGGIVVNGLMFNKEQAAQVGEARRQGRTIVSPGKPSDAVMIPQNQEIPASLYNSLQDQRQRFLERFGVSGVSNAGQNQTQTVRGKIIEGNNDSTRTGGGVTEFLEIASSRIYNYWLQMIYVYYDVPHLIAVMGPDNASQMIQLEASELPIDRKFIVKVQTGSMVPQDELSQYNQAMSLWEGGALDPLSLFEKLKDPNPQERAEKLLMYRTNPAQYMAQYLQSQTPVMQPMPMGGGGSESGAPPSSVPTMSTPPNPVQQQENQIIKSVPI